MAGTACLGKITIFMVIAEYLAMAMGGIMGGEWADFRTIALYPLPTTWVRVQNYSTSAILDIRHLLPDEGIYQGEPNPNYPGKTQPKPRSEQPAP